MVYLLHVRREARESLGYQPPVRGPSRVLASLNHPNIAAVYGLEARGGTTALVMELVEGLATGASLRDRGQPDLESRRDSLRISDAGSRDGIFGLFWAAAAPDGYTVSVYRELMIRSFADVTTADLWAERNSKAARRVSRELWPVVYQKLTLLDSDQRLDDLAAVPGNRFEALAGNRRGQHSIRVNQQYRITFRWEKHDAHDVCCEDYH